MKQLLQLELFKLKRLSSIKIILGVYAVIVPAWMYLYHMFMVEHPALKMLLGDDNEIYRFPMVWKFELWCASVFNVLLGVIIVIVTTNEIQFKTQRQNVIDGLSKRDMIMGRFIDIVLLSTIVTIFNVLVTFATAFIFSGNPGNPYDGIHLVPLFFLQTLAYFSVAFLLASLLKRPAISILLFIFVFPAEWIGSRFVSFEIRGFMPLRAMSDLVPSPFDRINALMQAKQEGVDHPWIEPLWMYVCTVLLIAGLIYWITYRTLLRRDL